MSPFAFAASVVSHRPHCSSLADPPLSRVATEPGAASDASGGGLSATASSAMLLLLALATVVLMARKTKKRQPLPKGARAPGAGGPGGNDGNDFGGPGRQDPPGPVL